MSGAGDMTFDCTVKKNFSFELSCIITCKGCGAEKTRIEEYNHLSLGLVPQGSIKDCLNLFFKDEEEIECRCEICEHSFASCRREFNTLPRFLVLQLKRFKLTKDFTLKKQKDRVQINPKIKLRMPEQSDHAQEDDGKHHDVDADQNEDRKVEKRTERHEVDQYAGYSLISALNHTGSSIYSGHYKCDSFSQQDSVWLSYNDDLVTIRTEESVLKKRQKSAYVLVYEMT
ncbi:ubiquitin carboxyl-terminal hydrolase 29-like [Trichomycterus rosablanca]|uniref:ubiquitin carboxyl-terminal hydrolase 29-like n=1 Tax=Trichomycterus rosablanca TaxID=2290929 RepID=UPI002F351ECD